MSRHELQMLKAQKEEERRISSINRTVDIIYKAAVTAATSSSETSLNYMIPTVGRNTSEPFYIQNMPSILKGLKYLFPDCAVSHAIMSKGIDGKLYDVSKLDNTTLPFVNRALDQSYIVIDWS